MARERSRSDFEFTAGAERGSAEESTMLAIVDHPFAKGESARAVRDPDNDARGIVVLSERALDDHALFLATSALEIDLRRFPSVTEPRVLHVWEDGRVTNDAHEIVGLVDLSLMPAERTTGVLEYLRARAAEDSAVEIPRIGRARLLKF